MHLFDALNPVLPEGSVDAFDGPENGLGRVGASDLWKVDFLCLEEKAFKFIGLGDKVNL